MGASNPLIIERDRTDYPNYKLPAKIAFTELMKFFYLCDLHKKESIKLPDCKNLAFQCVMHEEMKEIDDMWHTFILLTQSYADFCQKYFGYFIHHTPNANEKQKDKKTFKIEMQKYLSFIYDELGEKFLKIWFSIYFQ